MNNRSHRVVIFLFASYQRAFIFLIDDIEKLKNTGVKSLNIKKISKWKRPYVEIPMIPNKHKELLDYTGEWDTLIQELIVLRSD